MQIILFLTNYYARAPDMVFSVTGNTHLGQERTIQNFLMAPSKKVLILGGE
jgi:hypothetical protein